MSSSAPRVRFAPSPTGNVHIGNIRVAIFNWLFARHHGGSFLLRVEDTDRERSTPEAIATLLEALAWLGLDYDGEAMYQSRQLSRHQEAVSLMLEKKYASRLPGGAVVLHLDGPLLDPSFVSEAREEAEMDVSRGELNLTSRGIDYLTKASDGREFHNPVSWDALPGLRVVLASGQEVDGAPLRSVESGKADDILAGKPERLRFRRRYVYYHDMVLGHLEKPLDSIRDMVIVRSDGSPVFHLANVVDDINQGISHILRGNDHVENTYRHLFLFRALGAVPPRYAHFPMIVNSKGKPYSKRDGDAYVVDFRDKGYLPQCLFNFLALCGWSQEEGHEIMDRAEMVAAFDLDRVSASAAQLNLEKLVWMNGEYLNKIPIPELVPLVQAALGKAGINPGDLDPSWLKRLVALERDRLKTVAEFVANTAFFFSDQVTYDPKAVAKVLAKNAGAGFKVLAKMTAALTDLGVWEAKEIEEAAVTAVAGVFPLPEDSPFKMGEIAQPLRVAITGGLVSRGIWESLELLGKSKTLARLATALAQDSQVGKPV
ncbi:MAG: glutamate--tRNA ligase [Planctomycetota bacterium]|jgi:glutamyl-tRNA synthetase|nr:glutamate--tRNA ligase [Planctomycetota bacterium]